MRLFLAIELPETVRRHLGEVQEALRSHIRNASWTREGNLHLTLKFLGEVEDSRVAEVCDAVGGIGGTSPLELWAAGLELFPGGGAIRIIGAGFAGDVERLGGLVSSMESACAEIGFARESRAYRAHATLARARSPVASSLRGGLMEAVGERWPGPRFEVGHFVLMQSHLHSEGPRYVRLAEFGLG